MTDNRKVRDAQKFGGIGLGNKVKLEVILEGGKIYTSRETFNKDTATFLLSRLFKVGVHPVALKQNWEFTGIQR
jgi:hypothetical protein